MDSSILVARPLRRAHRSIEVAMDIENEPRSPNSGVRSGLGGKAISWFPAFAFQSRQATVPAVIVDRFRPPRIEFWLRITYSLGLNWICVEWCQWGPLQLVGRKLPSRLRFALLRKCIKLWRLGGWRIPTHWGPGERAGTRRNRLIREPVFEWQDLHEICFVVDWTVAGTPIDSHLVWMDVGGHCFDWLSGR